LMASEGLDVQLIQSGGTMFSNSFKLAHFGVVACAAVVLSGCQDAVAPITASEFSKSLPVVSASRESKAQRELINDQYIVVFTDAAGDVDAASRKLVGKTKGKLKHTFKSGLRGFSANMTADEAAVLAKDPSVKYVEQDQVVVAEGKPGAKVTQRNAAWGLDRVDQSAYPLSGTYTYSTTGAGVHVYIVDSGIRTTHTEFGGRATADFSLINDGYGATGCNWHGTHVAGIVGGKSSGVAKGVQLHSVRILDCNASGSVGGAVEGIEWVIANAKFPAVINLSVAGYTSTAFNDAVDYATAMGITVIAAAGNNVDDACNYSPASAANAFTVGATSPGDLFAFFSNYGPCIDILAPGESIWSASNTGDRDFQYGSGTSMAAPHVAGAAALYLQLNPLATPAEVSAAIVAGASAGTITGNMPNTANLMLRTQ
jgi:aqualysin 1